MNPGKCVALGFLFFSSIIMTSCAMIHSSTISEIKEGQGRRIRAVDTGNGFLMVSIPDLDAIAKLKAQCAGPITGVQSMTWMRNWIIVQHYQQEVTGWCQNPLQVNQR